MHYFTINRSNTINKINHAIIVRQQLLQIYSNYLTSHTCTLGGCNSNVLFMIQKPLPGLPHSGALTFSVVVLLMVVSLRAGPCLHNLHASPRHQHLPGTTRLIAMLGKKAISLDSCPVIITSYDADLFCTCPAVT